MALRLPEPGELDSILGKVYITGIRRPAPAPDREVTEDVAETHEQPENARPDDA